MLKRCYADLDLGWTLVLVSGDRPAYLSPDSNLSESQETCKELQVTPFTVTGKVIPRVEQKEGNGPPQRPDPPFKPRGREVRPNSVDKLALTSALHDKEYPAARRRRGEPLYQEHFNMFPIIVPIMDRHPN